MIIHNNMPITVIKPFFWALLVGITGYSTIGSPCCQAGDKKPEPPAAKPGVIFTAGGIGGLDILGASAQWALPHVGIHHEIRDFVWTHGWGHLFRDLQDTGHLLAKAEELAAEVRRYKAEHPDRPVYLMGKSGGTGLVLAAAEMLPPNTVERIILLSSAVSPDYDLRRALQATKGEIVSFYSKHDYFILGWGTSQFGTVDRVYGPSAGLRKFKVPPDLNAQDQALYDRLVQVPWNPWMICEGNTGAHFGTSLPAFLGKEVAPWFKP
jgi:pimeloyl-ACP methyl ester carboxylesterase